MALTTDLDEARNSATKPNGEQEQYVVLSAQERSQGFVRPLRRSYVHTTCGAQTSMALEIAETYARNPGFYGATYCSGCKDHHPVAEFVWDGTDEAVGS